jgi:RimJ/RimL family protein N-acetyltransferase
MVQPSLATDRLALRPFTPDDLAGFHAIWGDPEVIWWGKAAKSREESRAGLARLLARHRAWPDGIGWLAVIEKESGEIVGDVVLQPAPFVDGIEVGWHFRRASWNRGYATEAARAILDRAFAEGVLDVVHAAVATTNAPSLRVAEKLGMERVRAFVRADLDHWLFRLDAPGGKGA